MGQCGRVSLIGEMTEWSDDIFMDRHPQMPAEFSAFLTVTEADDGNADGVVEMKFRADADWATNWGGDTFPSGTAVVDGPNVPVPYGSYMITFNCETGEYNFTTTCGEIGLIGEMTEWAADIMMHRDETDINSWMVAIYVDESDDGNADGVVEMKFRQNADWSVNWGGDAFPMGTAVADGPNVPVPYGGYIVHFNCSTGEYNFVSTCGEIGLIGEFTGWASDVFMERDMMNPDMWHLVLTLTDDMDGDANGIIEMKFRAESDWGMNWGSDQFPSGTAVADGPNIPVPLDDMGLTTDYYVTFNCSTGEYNFHHTSGDISMIGAFVNWNGDVPMYRDEMNPDLWKLTRSWYADSEVKFRENNDWSVNWGNSAWPSGTGTDNGPNIPLVAGTYDVTFNYATLEYNFVANEDVCGEIGMVGDFNEWGGSGDVPTDVYLVRDPEIHSQFSLTYNFAGSTGLLFRVDAQPILNANVWGGTFPEDHGENDVTQVIQVPGGKYNITFNCLSGDFKFERLGNAVTAPKVFAISVDGVLDEADWDISQPVAQVVDGELTDDPNEVYFGVAYNDAYLFVGMDIIDGILTTGEEGELFVDGNKSGGAYDDFDIHLKFSAAGIEVIQGPDGIEPMLGFMVTATGYAAEVGIPWADLGVTPEEGGQIGFDVIIGDDDTNEGVDYRYAWNGGMQNYEGTSSFGDLLFGTLSCGCISLYGETIGDVVLMNPTDEPTHYVGTYNLDADYNVVFRKDMQATVQWGSDQFPTGTAEVDGPQIPATMGRYRVSFDCLTGEYTFEQEIAGEGVAYAEYISTPPVIDGDLSEYSLNYGMDAGVVAGTGPDDNTVTWGTRWDGDNLYFGAKVIDDVVEGTGNPWDNDAIEIYIDGNHDADGTYDGDYDTQLIMDALNESTLWVKADGAPVTNYESVWVTQTDGYTIEIRLGWDNFGFYPGKGRSIGWSVANNDSDAGVGRDYQTVWYGTGNNWSNTGDLGDLELSGGPYFFGIGDLEFYNDHVMVYPNPASNNVNLEIIGDVFGNNVDILVTDLSGRTTYRDSESEGSNGSRIQINVNSYAPGLYFVNILGEDGQRAVKKLIVR